MQHHNYWETLLHQRFPEHQLVVRNLCFPADEINVRPRSLNFGSPDDHLKRSQTDVILCFFGFNESFQAAEGIESFRKDLHDLVQRVGDIFGERVSRKGIALKIDVSAEVPQAIVSDAAKLRQILVNLLGNAVKFTDQGQVALHICERPRGCLRFDLSSNS